MSHSSLTRSRPAAIISSGGVEPIDEVVFDLTRQMMRLGSSVFYFAPEDKESLDIGALMQSVCSDNLEPYSFVVIRDPKFSSVDAPIFANFLNATDCGALLLNPSPALSASTWAAFTLELKNPIPQIVRHGQSIDGCG